VPEAAWPAALERGVALRAIAGERRSGDRPVLLPYDGGVLVGAIDGLGHGGEAADAAELAERVLAAAPAEEPGALLQRCHRALTRSRGVVMTLAWIDLGERSGGATLRWTGVGNVEGRLVRSGGDPRVPTEGAFVRGGVVGYNLPAVRVTSTPFQAGDVVVFATDGIGSGFARSLADGGTAQEIADRIMGAHAKATDDALAVVVRLIDGPAA
jgi:negative regulator of sigma-B (phosphoserine phosphatase)